MGKIDGSGPPPLEYHARQEWLARRRGAPPVLSGPSWYNIPTDYNARQKQLKDYGESARKLRGR